jgi:hypothetical protein
VETHGHVSILKEQYTAVQNVLFILLVNKLSNASKLATGSMLMSVLYKVFTIDTQKCCCYTEHNVDAV